MLIKKADRTLTVVPGGDLGPWRLQQGPRYPMFSRHVLGDVPTDRGVKLPRLDAALLRKQVSSGPVLVSVRSSAERVVRPAGLANGPLTLAPSAADLDYVVAPD